MSHSAELKDFVEKLDGAPILIFGLGRSGMSSAKVLKAAGANIIVGDDNANNLEKARKAGFDLLDLKTADCSKFAFLLLSPGIPFTHPTPHEVVKRAQDADIEIICDVELFSRVYPKINTIGVTGTNGKSTTSSLINYVLNETGKKALLGGNIGTPVFDLKVKDENTWVVIEMSSFQIDLCPNFRPDISVLLNISPDHIDRHGSMENYCAVKEKIIQISQNEEYNLAVICSDDPHTQKIYDRAKGLRLRNIYEISTDKEIHNGVYVSDDVLHDAIDGGDEQYGGLDKVQSLKGAHNYQNAAAAFAVVKLCGVAPSDIWHAMQSFPGLNHRQYLVRTINGVTYINDSKSTNAASAAVALGCRNNVYWIVGGRKKKNGLEGLEEFFPRIKHAFLIGESTEDFAQWFDKYGMEYTRCYDLKKALSESHEMAQKNRGQPGGAGTVLLSPACASFDQFDSFEHRGDVFTQIVTALDE
ncbi:MAG: UDP-N-acetylmuramoyl-L-alanine--D-glutamate ligase [Alphaproteobacteria bacterium]